MVPARDHIDKPLISITDGAKLGEVKDLYLDADMRRVAAVFVGKEGFLRRQAYALPRSAVQVYGIDAWLIAGSDTVLPLEEIPDWQSYVLIHDLRGREIVTEGDTKIGVVEDVLLDEEARVIGFTLGRVFVQGPVAERKAIARDAISSLGGKDTPMKTTLEQVESLPVP